MYYLILVAENGNWWHITRLLSTMHQNPGTRTQPLPTSFLLGLMFFWVLFRQSLVEWESESSLSKVGQIREIFGLSNNHLRIYILRQRPTISFINKSRHSTCSFEFDCCRNVGNRESIQNNWSYQKILCLIWSSMLLSKWCLNTIFTVVWSNRSILYIHNILRCYKSTLTEHKCDQFQNWRSQTAAMSWIRFLPTSLSSLLTESS